ncbi:hypothetical protein SAMD00019534_056420 [Acytostelium subglobosum LB1]|uniref:hypothetical protein n=1 Tax=Acytostelium subglobosum LB1 TaxID=1410327 RepID=UPI0006450D2F|nr:hypothetical protein SAMD00019534_056420 [Acytostelium subglobosum LB1]GAM22467.1 hypothetical protein SAMD00019534_056420 [Acytostelium subglobosum LB1]|eukprot:XP_012754587.1 hypothetical protein SAMD00019534_056420 [Acytostelium subglobosum LB1]
MPLVTTSLLVGLSCPSSSPLIEITFYASCLKFYARYIKALKSEVKNGEYVPVSSIVEIEVESNSAAAPSVQQPQQAQPQQHANFYPAQLAQFAQAMPQQQPASPSTGAPQQQPQQPYFVPVNIPFGQQIQSIQMPNGQQQGQQQQYYPMQYYYVVPSMPNPNIAVDKN